MPPRRRPVKQGRGEPIALAAGDEPKPPPDAAEAARLVQLAVLRKAEAIAAGLILRAEEGSYPHAKFLFEFAGLFPAVPVEETPAEDSPLAGLMEHLR